MDTQSLSLYFTLFKMTVTLKQTLRAGSKGVQPTESCLYSYIILKLKVSNSQFSWHVFFIKSRGWNFFFSTLRFQRHGQLQEKVLKCIALWLNVMG